MSNCGCRVVGASSAKGAERLGARPGYTAPPEGWDARDAKGRLPGIDEGWDYMPGGISPIIQHLAQKTATLPKPLAEALQAHVLRYMHPSDIVRFEQQQSKAREKLLQDYLGEADYRDIKRYVEGIKDARLTLADKIAIHAYTRDGWYKRLNDALKQKSVSKGMRYMRRHEAMITALDAALAKLPNYRGEVRRGLGQTRQLDKFAALKPGDILQFTQYLSTSYEGPGFTGSVKLIIQARTAKKVDHLSKYPSEKEAIIPRGTQFRVTKVERDKDGVIFVHMDELKADERVDVLPSAYMKRGYG